MSEITPLTKDQLFEKKIAENTGSDYNVGDISDVVPVTKDQSFLKEIALNSAGQSEDITELEEKVTANAEAIEATQDMISDAYDSTHTYNVGDYCIHENVLYKCNTASTTGTWDSSKWDAVTITNEVREMPDLSVITPTVSEPTMSIMLGGVVKYGRLVIVQVRLLTQSSIPSPCTVFTGLPKPYLFNNLAYDAVQMVSNNGTANIDAEGILTCRVETPGAMVIITGSYIWSETGY